MASIQSIIIRQRIANVLRLRRKQLNITQRGMDDLCGREKCWYAWRERGATDISAQELLIIAAALECTPHEIYIAAGLMKAGTPVLVAVLAGLLVGGLVGVFNGFAISKLGITPFVTTLATQSMCRGLVLVFMNGKNVGSLPSSFTWIGQIKLGDVQLPVIYALVFVVVGHFLLSKSRFFRQNYYIGGNFKAAKLSGIHTDRMQIVNYMIMGLLAAFAGIVLTARLGSASTTAGTGVELKVITAVIIGGASMSGGEGTVIGAFLGCVLMSLIANAMTLLDVSVYWQTFVTGFTLLVAVLIDRYGKIKQGKTA